MGNEILVKISKTGEQVREYILTKGQTVRDALYAGDFQTSDVSVSVDFSPATLDTVLESNAVIVVGAKVEGGIL